MDENVRDCEGFEILYYFHENRVIDAGRRHETLGSETKDLVTYLSRQHEVNGFVGSPCSPSPWSNEEVGSERYCTYNGCVSHLSDTKLSKP